MGEYAKFNGEEVKIGTCEDMLYLRWDQRHMVEPLPSNVDPADREALDTIRFRFPFPDEDHITPSGFDDPFRSVRLDGFEQPESVQHRNKQFAGEGGYLVMLPCPEETPRGVLSSGTTGKDYVYRIQLNGYGGAVKLKGQAWRDGKLCGIVECGGCGETYRLDYGHEAAAAVALRSAADRATRNDRASEAVFFHTIADRLIAGYSVEAAAIEVTA